MKKSKLFMSLLVVVLMLSFAITTVGAQSEIPPVGEQDEDGEIFENFPPEQVNVMEGLPGPEYLTFPEGLTGVESTPLSPSGSSFVYTKFPTFTFSEDPGATKYRIVVYDVISNPDVLVYTIKGSGNCSGGVCTLTPALPLKPLDLDPATLDHSNNGYYKWLVQSKTIEGWGGWSTPASFFVIKNGFHSDFTTLDQKWLPVYGTWNVTSAGYLKTNGYDSEISSVIQKFFVSDYYVYEVKMKRKVEESSANRIYFHANPVPSIAVHEWESGYVFQYANEGTWSLYKLVNGVAIEIVDWTFSPYINPYDWNVLTVKSSEFDFDIWINGHYLGWYEDPSYSGSYSGFGMYKSDTVSSPLLVDYATLEYTTESPYPTVLTADGQHDPAYELKSVEGITNSDPNRAP